MAGFRAKPSIADTRREIAPDSRYHAQRRPLALRHLLILRHAKAAHDPEFEDHERPLTKKGERTAKRVGRLLAEQGLTPSLILSSTALRARETAELSAGHADFDGTIELIDDLYLAEPSAYVTALARRGANHQRVMVVGHNPGLEALVERLTGRSEHLPTGGLVACDLPLENWADLSNMSAAWVTTDNVSAAARAFNVRVWRLKDDG
jgi:phosphohistidine phosphatase